MNFHYIQPFFRETLFGSFSVGGLQGQELNSSPFGFGKQALKLLDIGLHSRVAGLHVGGKSALALQGVRHNLAMRDTLVLWGDARFVLPPLVHRAFPGAVRKR